MLVPIAEMTNPEMKAELTKLRVDFSGLYEKKDTRGR